MPIIMTDGLQKFLEMFATSHVQTIAHQGAMVKNRLLSKEWVVAVADGSNPDGLMALGDFLGYGSIADQDIEMFSFPMGTTSLVVATLRGTAFSLESVQEFFPNHPQMEGYGWESNQPALILADYDESPRMFDGFVTWLESCGKEMN